jgi:hypothetical protein
MKILKKSAAIAVLGTMLLANVSSVNSEWVHSTETLHH